MGYESCVEGQATGADLVAQLRQAGFAVENGQVVDPQGYLTGTAVVDESTLQGTRKWCAAYGFEALAAALRRVVGLAVVDLQCRGQEQDDRSHLIYHDGRWYELLVIAACVREGCGEAAQAAAFSALAPFALPG